MPMLLEFRTPVYIPSIKTYIVAELISYSHV